ncbi:virulence protein SciE type [bacterium]|nr:virulence protein SciE type [Mariniblastus sp.]MDB4392073.1 virulence protein SciE type [bacterium]
MSKSRQALQNKDLSTCLNELKSEIRSAPTNHEKRVFYFQLLCVFGEWDKALTQLDVCRDLNSSNLSMSQTYEQVLQCEKFRDAVFRGKQTATILGEPPTWVALMQQAVKHAAEDDWTAFTAIQNQAFEQATTTSGKILLSPTDENGETADEISFNWIADADPRFGPMIECIVNGRYFWVPLESIQSIEIEKPADLRDLVWTPAQFVWRNKGEAVGFIPTRYPQSEKSVDDHIKIAGKTEWTESNEGTFLGLGMRMFATETNEFSLAEISKVVFHHHKESENVGT